MYLLKSFVLSVLTVFTCAVSHADEKNTVKLGVLTSLSGAVAEWGQNTREGMELALDEVNSEVEIHGRTLQLLFEDFGNLDPKKTSSGAQRLLQIEKVRVLLTQWAEDTEIAWPLARKENVLTMTYAAGSRDITKGRKLLFRIWPSDDLLIRRVIRYAAAASTAKPCIIWEQTAYFESMRAIAEEEWLALTKAKPLTIEHAPDVTDFRSYVLPLKECSSIVLLTEVNLLATLVRQVHAVNPSALLLSYPAVAAQSVLDNAGSGLDGVIYAAYPTATSEFAHRFAARYGHPPAPPAASAYDAVKILGQVIQKRGTLTEKIVSGLREIQNFPGASGTVSFTEDGDRSPLDSQLYKVIGGKVEPIG